MATTASLFAQSEVSIESPPGPRVVGPLLKPFHLEKRVVPPARLTNSPRLEQLVRGGNLYLTVQDVIALVLENNLDIAIQRYGPYLSREVLRRAEGGGILRPTDQPVLPGPQSVSLAGVSLNTAGLAGGAGVGAIGSIVTQVGPNPPNFDPGIFFQGVFGHQTSPQSNAIAAQTSSLVYSYQVFTVGYSQQFVTGANAALTYQTAHNSFNSPNYSLNPYNSAYLDLQINQPLLQGFSPAVNRRDIQVAKNNAKYTDLQMKRQVSTTIAACLNLYWDLVSFNEDVRIKQGALATAQKLYEDNQAQVKLGTLPAIEVTRAAAQVSASKEDLLIAQTNVAQQETVLKNALSRNGLESAWLDEVHIIPLDHIEVPKTEDLKPVNELIQVALENRPELQQSRTSLESQKIMLKGDKNALLPVLNGFVELTNNALAGPISPIYNGSSGPIDPFFVGGYGSTLSQLFHRNFPNYSAGFALNIPFRNRAAQGDYVTDQLQIRQSELQLQRAMNQVRLDVKNAVIGLQQARTRYETAVTTRELADQNLKAEQDRFQFGAVADASLVIQAQRDLSTAQSGETQAMANYTHAKIGFDEAIGQTLELNHISFQEAKEGRVARQSTIPDNVPGNRR